MKYSCSFPQGYHESGNSPDDPDALFVLEKDNGDRILVTKEFMKSRFGIGRAMKRFRKSLEKDGNVILEIETRKRYDGNTYGIMNAGKNGQPVLAAVMTMLGEFFITGTATIRSDDTMDKMDDLAFLFESLTVLDDD